MTAQHWDRERITGGPNPPGSPEAAAIIARVKAMMSPRKRTQEPQLTEQEIALLQHLAQGLTQHEAGLRQGLKQTACETAFRKIRGKLGIDNKHELRTWATDRYGTRETWEAAQNWRRTAHLGDALTDREVRVATLLAHGMTQVEAARVIGIGRTTCGFVCADIRTKIGLEHHAALVAWARHTYREQAA